MTRIGAVILAAGASRRLGRPKQLVKLGFETLLARTVRVAGEAGCSSVVVVLGFSAAQIRSDAGLDGCSVVVNANWARGMGSSIAAGIQSLQEVTGALVLTCDMPSVTADHLRSLCSAGDLTGSDYRGRIGVPAFFPARMFADLRGLDGDTGAKELLRSARSVALADGDLDIDTEEDLRRVRSARVNAAVMPLENKPAAT